MFAPDLIFIYFGAVSAAVTGGASAAASRRSAITPRCWAIFRSADCVWRLACSAICELPPLLSWKNLGQSQKWLSSDCPYQYIELVKGVDQSLIDQPESIIIVFFKYQHQSMAAGEKNGQVSTSINTHSKIVQSHQWVHHTIDTWGSCFARRFWVNLVDFGQFWAIWDDFDVDFWATVSAFGEGRQSLNAVWSTLDHVGQFGTISTSILGKCQCFQARRQSIPNRLILRFYWNQYQSNQENKRHYQHQSIGAR